MGECAFDQKDYIKLPERRRLAATAIHGLLLKSLPKKVVESNDSTLLDALTYELLRLHVSNQAKSFGGLGEEERNLDDNDEKIPRAITEVFRYREEKDGPDNFDILCRLLEAFGASDKVIGNLFYTRQFLQEKTIRIRREAHSLQMGRHPHTIDSIPPWIKPSQIRRPLFLYRWCLILAHSDLSYSRMQSIELYETFFRFCRGMNPKKLSPAKKIKGHNGSETLLIDLDEFSPEAFRDSLIGGFLPCLPKITNPENDAKTISKLTTAWAVEFMHLDYANLINWTKFPNPKQLPFLPQFVANKLGCHILKARYRKKWTHRSPEWTKALKIKGNIPRINEIESEIKNQQPISIGTKKIAFSYVTNLPTSKELEIIDASELSI